MRTSASAPVLIDAPVSNPRIPMADVASDAEIAAPWIGRTVAKRYRILRHVASGGMAQVFLAQHVGLGGSFAIKLIARGSDPNAVRYLRNEARLLSRLHHPNIVSVFDFTMMRGGDCFITMAWQAGRDLGGFIGREGPLSPVRALWVLTQLASALDYIHSRGIVHRDVKPDNVFFEPTANDLVTLFDFGVAHTFLTPDATEQGKLIGTPLYMSPEQAAGLPATPASDLYGLAAVALELLTGRQPYPQMSPSNTLRAVRTQPPASASASGLEVSGLDAVLAKAMAREPEERFCSGEAFVSALADVLSPGAQTANRSHENLGNDPVDGVEGTNESIN